MLEKTPASSHEEKFSHPGNIATMEWFRSKKAFVLMASLLAGSANLTSCASGPNRGESFISEETAEQISSPSQYIDQLREGLSFDTTEKSAQFSLRNGKWSLVLEQLSVDATSVDVNGQDVKKLLERTYGEKYVWIHSHPPSALLASGMITEEQLRAIQNGEHSILVIPPSINDIISIATMESSSDKEDAHGQVVDPSGVWTFDPSSQSSLGGLAEGMAQDSTDIFSSISPELSAAIKENTDNTASHLVLKKIYDSYPELRAEVDSVEQKIIANAQSLVPPAVVATIEHLHEIQIGIISAKDQGSRDVMIAEYIQTASELGVTIKYETDDGRTYE